MAEKKEVILGGAVKLVDQGARGRGLVADQDFDKGGIVTLYSSKENKTGPRTSKQYIYCFQDFQTKRYYIGNAEGGGLAAFINDAAPPELISTLKQCKTVNAVDIWARGYLSTLMGQPGRLLNIKFTIIDGNLYATALKNIKKGENLFTVYGHSYWIALTSMDATASTEARLACTLWSIWAEKGLPPLAVVHNLWGFVSSLDGCIALNPFHPKIRVMSDKVMVNSEKTAGTITGSIQPAQEEIDDLCNQWCKVFGLPQKGENGWRDIYYPITKDLPESSRMNIR